MSLMQASAKLREVDTISTCAMPWRDSGRQLEAARAMRRARRRRSRFFLPTMFSDPAWDILLELYIAECEQRRLSIADLSDRSGVPGTTALRWLEAFEKETLVTRRCDPLDGRRVYINLSARGIRAMQAYFESETTVSADLTCEPRLVSA
jgi:DNA-binding MarR family transcriptional regulator